MVINTPNYFYICYPQYFWPLIFIKTSLEIAIFVDYTYFLCAYIYPVKSFFPTLVAYFGFKIILPVFLNIRFILKLF